MSIHFEKVTQAHLDTIFNWLTEPHIIEFWDNSQAHKDDIINFTLGRKIPSPYCDGKYVYWIASFNNEPFAMLMTIQETHKEDIDQENLSRLSKTGATYGLDFMIGNPQFLGKGHGAKTLSAFIEYFRTNFDSKADTFLIDPDSSNPRAKHVYMKAGFSHVCDFVMEGDVSGTGKMHHLLIKKFEPEISVIEASINDHPLVQNMARFYVYDLSRECGSISADWALLEDGLYESFDFKHYLTESSRKAYLVKVYEEIAGFVLLNQETEDPTNTWNMGEFFVIAKFQGQGIASRVAHKIRKMNPGTWEVSVIPENNSALRFLQKAISEFTFGAFNKQIKRVVYDEDQPRRIIFEFDTQNSTHINTTPKIITRQSQLSDIDALVSRSKVKRLAYEKVQPQFWRYAGETGDEAQKQWFKELLESEDYLMFTAEDDHQEIVGFVIGKLMPAPEVYNPGGLTLMIDDFCVSSPTLWETVGKALIKGIKADANAKGAAQVLVVCGSHDYPKRKFLGEQNLSIASEWFVGTIL